MCVGSFSVQGVCVLSLLQAEPCSCCIKDNILVVLKFDFNEKTAFVGNVVHGLNSSERHPNANAALTGTR